MLWHVFILLVWGHIHCSCTYAWGDAWNDKIIFHLQCTVCIFTFLFGDGQSLYFHFLIKSTFLVSKGLLCLYKKQNNTWLPVDTEFLFLRSINVSLVCCALSQAIELNTREIPYQCAPMYSSLFIINALMIIEMYMLWLVKDCIKMATWHFFNVTEVIYAV